MTADTQTDRRPAIDPDIALAERLFAELKERTSDGRGVTRASYGAGETLAHSMIRREAEALGLEVDSDAARNLYLSLRGKRDLPRIIIGSHLDSVPMGGNFDGAAGVLMGLSVLAALVRHNLTPPRTITVMVIRAEESAWFGSSYIGSRAAFGRLTAHDLDTVARAGDGVNLARAIDAAGGNAAWLRSGNPHLDPGGIACFIEPHIEQGPVLVARDYPVGLVSAIRGSFRYRHASCHGVYAHSGATPREIRADAVRAAATLIVELDLAWQRMNEAGDDLTVTVGQFATDPDEASFSKVAGLVRFSLDVRGSTNATLERAQRELDALTDRISRQQKVRFDLGARTSSTPARMHPGLTDALEDAATDLAIPVLRMPSGAGHDAATFAAMGVPTGMVFIRNEHGSHNPGEHMEMADFAAASRILMRFCLSPPVFST